MLLVLKRNSSECFDPNWINQLSSTSTSTATTTQVGMRSASERESGNFSLISFPTREFVYSTECMLAFATILHLLRLLLTTLLLPPSQFRSAQHFIRTFPVERSGKNSLFISHISVCCISEMEYTRKHSINMAIVKGTPRRCLLCANAKPNIYENHL